MSNSSYVELEIFLWGKWEVLYPQIIVKKADLRGANLRGALLIAADLKNADLRKSDLIGADLRDADLSGTDLRGSIFLTQAQVNSAKGNADTTLPGRLTHPNHWQRVKQNKEAFR
ncbi:pentapeptide repeat-containing protein [Fictibacillus sp. Sa2CUA10]|uniref:Pentapeptide repeat-containing protein n=1 Tax=Fictibacillus norfolkensis TaxID=2762233 RepID=A0ABR8SJ05_9BACL|nr:pentapeptide repeat-containing protein [Fictibacillus norfolkensis]